MELSSVMCGIGCAYLLVKSAIYETKNRLFEKRNAAVSFGVPQSSIHSPEY